ncbi:MAG TPA: DUF4406 domain-containing protein [Anaerolineaceae bacterium]|nr:DUF4406 domain-containing protein [Clostridia bacterium]HPK26838.1 DUF4406 domain-containing protein [Anaerolineaceae bacterium]
MSKTIYLAGKITGDPAYKAKFAAAAEKLAEMGYIVVNPALLPSVGFTYDQYMRMSCAMLDECQEICLLPDWVYSPGAIEEALRAMTKKMSVHHYNILVGGNACD